jgi:hypothetical protein
VPFFFYLLHIPLIHVTAILVAATRSGRLEPWLFENHPVVELAPPAGYVWSLGLLYLVTVVIVTTLYLPCRWYGDLKRRGASSWLRYL